MILRYKLRTLDKRNKRFSSKGPKNVIESTNFHKILKKMTLMKYILEPVSMLKVKRKITRNNKNITKAT